MGRRRYRGPLPTFENVEIIDAGSEGKAVAKVDDMVIFVPFVVPGDIVDIQTIGKKKSFYEGKAVKFHKYSELRTEAFCEHFGVCGGCKWQGMDYKHQLQFKQKQVKDNLERIGKIDTTEMMDILPSAETKFYRNKLEFSFSSKRWLINKDDVLNPEDRDLDALGFHVPGRFDRVLDVNTCYLMEEPMNAIRLAVRKHAKENGLTFYDARTHEGFLRNLLIRNTLFGDLMVILSVNSDEQDLYIPILEMLRDNFPQITSLMYVINTKKNDTINDLEVKLFHGKDHMIEEMEGLQYKIGPLSFFQTNGKQAYELYKVARDFADLKGDEHVYDLYTGTGTIANFVAKKAKHVVGIEYVEMAIEDAKVNSDINKIENTSFFAGDMAKVLTPEFIEENGNPDVIITDPPRAGMHEKVVQQILKVAPEKVVYISCNPATQARDVNLMLEAYEVEKIRPVDMFPHTHHVENVMLLRRK
jgi:23S rRNA (uracil1939-C5)-methyltransferase